MHNREEIMGARTDHRKRSSDVFSLSYNQHLLCGSIGESAVFPGSFDVEILHDLTPSKKPRIMSSKSMPEPVSNQPSHTMSISISKFTSLPPPTPLRRALHCPQRISKFIASKNFYGESNKSRLRAASNVKIGESPVGMGNYLARKRREVKIAFEDARKDVVDYLRGFGKDKTAIGDGGESLKVAQNDLGKSADLGPSSPKDTADKGLGIEEYREMVSRQEGYSMISDPRSSQTSLDVHVPKLSMKHLDSHFEPSSSVVSDTTALSPKFDVGKKIESPFASHVEDIEVRRPLYKELLESSKKQDRRLQYLDFEVKLNSEKFAALNFMSQGFKKQVEELRVHKPFTPLTDEEESEVENAFHGSNRRQVLVTHQSSNIEITRGILQCLLPSAWLNDEVINLYLELLKERERRDPKNFLRCHFFNTFFYKKLVSGRSGYDFKAVRRWTTLKKIGYGLNECDKIFVPIHKEIHWCLAVINLKDKKLQYLDSLKGMDGQVLNVLARYFADEVKDKSDMTVDLGSWKQEFVDNLPVQENGFDCGMFMIKYADFYSRGLGLSFGQEHMPYFRKRTAKEILNLRAD